MPRGGFFCRKTDLSVLGAFHTYSQFTSIFLLCIILLRFQKSKVFAYLLSIEAYFLQQHMLFEEVFPCPWVRFLIYS